MKYAALALGLWLAGAQGFAAQACCSDNPSPKSPCGDCGDESKSDSPSRPDCCTSLEAQKDVELTVPKNQLPQTPLVVEFLSEDTSFAPRLPEAADLLALQAVSRAEGPPLYLRYEVLLI